MSAQFAHAFESTDNVVGLFRPRSTTASTSAGRYAVRGEESIDELIARIEAAGYHAVAKSELRARHSPFDAVYLSALRTDHVQASDIEMITRFARLEDCSAEFGFDDGLD